MASLPVFHYFHLPNRSLSLEELTKLSGICFEVEIANVDLGHGKLPRYHDFALILASEVQEFRLLQTGLAVRLHFEFTSSVTRAQSPQKPPSQRLRRSTEA